MLRKVLAVFPVFILFAFSGLFVFASPSSPVVFDAQRQDLTTAEKQDHTWDWIKSELRDNYTYLDFGDGLKPLLDAAHNDDYNKKGSELEQEVKIWLSLIFVAAKENKKGALAFLLQSQSLTLEQQKLRWNSLVDASIGENQDALLNPQYAHLAKTLILIKKKGKEYKVSLEPLFLAAKRFGVVKTAEDFSKIKIPGFRKMIWDFCFLFFVGEKEINAALTTADAENKPKLNNLWTGIKDELKTKYAHLSKTLINIGGTDYNLEPLFTAAKDDTQYQNKGSELSVQAKKKLQELVDAVVIPQKFKDALGVKNNENLNALWTGIKDELKKAEYAHLSKTLINIGGTDYNLEPLFTAAKDDTQYQNKGSQLPDPAKDKLQELVNDIVTAQNVKDALDVKNNENLNALWSGIKDELKKSEYTYLAETAITVDETDYDLEPLFAAAKYYAQYEKKGSELPARAKNKLQSLVNAGVQHQIFKASLTKANIQKNQKLDDLWTQVKKILNQPEFSKLKNTSIKIKNKNYDLELLFAAAKKKVGVKDSAFSLDAKLQLQKFLNDQVTSKMIENQLLALKQAEAAKNQWIKEIQQRQLLTTGLVTGGVLLVAAGLGGFYWFFKIRK